MPRFFAPPVAFDVVEADNLVWEVFRRLNYTHESSRYGEQISTEPIGAQLAEMFKQRHVIRDRKHLKANPDLAAWKEDVAEGLYGDEPLLHSARSLEEEAARDCLVNKAWEYASTSLTSPLNVALSQMDGYVLLQAKVAKKRPRPGMKGVALPAEARFLTQDLELILDLSVNPGIMSWRRATSRFDVLLKEIGERRPELRLAIAKAVAREIPSVTGLLVHADPKNISVTQPEESQSRAEKSDEVVSEPIQRRTTK